MTLAVVVWSEAQYMRWAELQEGVSAELGRNPNANITVGDTTVSREHARFSHHAGKFYIENLSRTNPTKVNQVTIDNPTSLSDGDIVEVGIVQLVFHDLTSTDRISGLVCSHCSRENLTTDRDCWYCGTSLVNAPTIIARRLPLACRIVSETGQCHNLYPGEVFAVDQNGKGELLKGEEAPADAVAVVTLQDGNPLLVSGSSAPTITFNGANLSSPQELRTGDELRCGEGHFLFIVP